MVQENSLKKVLVICGATATGKTALAIECAKTLDTEIVSADSMCVYKGFDVGTAKPTEEEKEGIPYHMIDVAEPTAEYSVGDYREGALPIIDGLIARGKIPIICGGTGFYVNSLLFDLSYGNAPKNEGVRSYYEEIAARDGKEKLHDILREKDPLTAEKLHPNDVKRIVRALEIYEVSGRRKSEISDGNEPRYDYSSFCIDFKREELYDRINSRVDAMIAAGLIEEVINLLDCGVGEGAQSMQGIGYKEVCAGLKEGRSAEE
ncbi:MAG: tRNA (adenosine(37)-N6)-dimethylallyltransferase MiaA, partial [Clostridia bacterium]|nr:tRNA (adenosine(37)-N6)-dimethylallyltransferase MiaA [Clostridia bacterium]